MANKQNRPVRTQSLAEPLLETKYATVFCSKAIKKLDRGLIPRNEYSRLLSQFKQGKTTLNISNRVTHGVLFFKGLTIII